MDMRERGESLGSRRLLLICVFVLVWELLGRPFLAHLCPEHELPPSLIRELVEMLATIPF